MNEATDHSSPEARIKTISATIQAFWRWWITELAAMLPEGLRGSFRSKNKSIYLELGENECRLFVLKAKQTELLTTFPLDQEPDPETRQQHQQLTSMTDQLILKLPQHYLLRKTIYLPSATRHKLDDVLKFEMDRNTPFKAEEVYFTFNVQDHQESPDKIQVEVAIVTRVILDNLLQQLHQLGIDPDHVTTDDLNHNQPLLPEQDLLRKSSDPIQKGSLLQQQKFWFVLTLILVLIAGLFYQRDRQEASLQQQITEPRIAAEQTRNIQNQLNLRIEGRQQILQMKQQDTSRLILLDQLTRILPDHTWLMRLSINNQQITLQGESDNASSLIALLEQTEQFSGVSFSSPVTLNPRTRKERFTITASIQSGGRS